MARVCMYNLPGLGESHPENEDKLEDIVKGCHIVILATTYFGYNC